MVFALTSCVLATALVACRDKSPELRKQQLSVFEQLAEADLSPVAPERKKRGPGAPQWDEVGDESYVGDDRDLRAGARSGVSDTARPRRRGIAATDEGYEINFSDAPLPELVKIVLKDTLGIPYVYDSRVQGKVTLATGRAVSREELLAALEAVLQMNRAALVKRENGYNIVSEASIKNGGALAIDYAEEARRIGPGYGVTIFPLRYVSSETILDVLTAFVAKAGALRADVRRNLLMIRGTGRERAALVGVASQFDADWIKGQSVGIYPLRHANPEDLIAELEQIFQTGADGLGKNMIRFRPMARLKAILVLTNRRALLAQARSWIRRLDRTNEAAIRTFVYHVENGKAKDLAKLLNDVFTGSSSTSSEAEEVEPDTDIADIESGTAGATERDTTAGATEITTAPTTTVSSTGSDDSSLSEKVRVVADEIKNNLIIRTSGHVWRQMQPVLRDLDQAPAQVIINATLAEVTLNDNLRYGVQVFLRNGEQTRLGGFTNGDVLNIAPELPGLHFLAGMRVSPKVVLDALSAETSVRVVSSPSVVVVDNQPATLKVGDEVPVATRSATSVTDPQAPIVNNIEFRDTGVILKVTPRISNEGVVTMEIEQEISNVANATTPGAPGSLTPTITQRRISSTISVQSGQMVVLGGLINERKQHIKGRVPLWEKVPFLGQFPGRTSNESTRTELVVFLLPQIIHNAAEASLIAEELRARLWSLRPKRRRKYERWPKPRWSKTLHDEPGIPSTVDPRKARARRGEIEDPPPSAKGAKQFR